MRSIAVQLSLSFVIAGPAARRNRNVLTVNEIFHSIQGESTHAGRPCIFVRLTACDLRCSWCDTPYAFYEGRKMSLDEVMATVEGYGCSLVELTGGEPLLQKDVYPLMERLIASGKTVLVETGGHLSLAGVPPAVHKIMDVKCPGSGESHRVDWSNLARLSATDEVKFVLRDRADYDYARAVVLQHELDRKVGAVLFSPVHGVLDPRTLSEWVLADRLPVRVQLQVHKYIWDAQTRGV
jgi:7-carboxy-7-deazaguanine synthase